MPYRVILQTTNDEDVESEDVDAALTAAVAAAEGAMDQTVHGCVQYNVYGISPHDVADRGCIVDTGA